MSLPSDQTAPDVAYDNRQEQYLVVWQEGTSDIRGRRVSPNGTLLDSSDIDLSTTAHTYRYWPRVAMRDADDDVFWLHGDHLGSTSLTSDEDGDVVARQLYYPFGETRWVTGTLPTDFGYAGQRDDAYTQLYEMGARWYDNRICRWIQPDTVVPDPADPQSLDRFGYVRNNPLVHVDPTGHFDCSVVGGPSGGMDCRKWVYNALAVLDIYGGNEGKELYGLFWELDSNWLDNVDILFWMPLDNVEAMAPPFEFPYDLWIKSDYLASDPLAPANWHMAATLAHEIVHLGQDNAEKLSIQGEAKAYQVRGTIVDELNKNLPRSPGPMPIPQSPYSVKVKGLDLTTYEGVVQAYEGFEDLPGNIFNWQPVFPADEWYFKKWWYQLRVTGTSIVEGAWSLVSGLW